MKLGDFVKRNNRSMMFPTVNTTSDAKNIVRDNEYEITLKRTAGNGSVFGITSIQTGIKYEISAVDMTDYFDRIQEITQKPIERTTESIQKSIPKHICKCTTKCDSLHLLQHGCKYSTLEQKYQEMQQERMGPKMGEKE